MLSHQGAGVYNATFQSWCTVRCYFSHRSPPFDLNDQIIEATEDPGHGDLRNHHHYDMRQSQPRIFIFCSTQRRTKGSSGGCTGKDKSYTDRQTYLATINSTGFHWPRRRRPQRMVAFFFGVVTGDTNTKPAPLQIRSPSLASRNKSRVTS